MSRSTFEGAVGLIGATIDRSLFLKDGAIFKNELNLTAAKIGSNLEMDKSTFEGEVILNSATIEGAAFFRKRAIFKSKLELTAAKIGSSLEMDSSTFEQSVILDKITVGGPAFLRSGATFKGVISLVAAEIGSGLEMSSSTFEGDVNLMVCKVTETLYLGSSESSAARWKDGASLTLRNTHVGALQDWWRVESVNAWPKTYWLEGFTFDHFGPLGTFRESDVLARPAASYIKWLAGDPGTSPQPYEHLARRFREAGQPVKANAILYAARERRRRRAWSTVDNHGQAKKREWLNALGLWLLRSTIGYGLGGRYFCVLGWMVGLTLLGTLVLVSGSHSVAEWPQILSTTEWLRFLSTEKGWQTLFASLDQLLPIITFDKAHDSLVFGNLAATPPIDPRPYWVRTYFYFHKLLGWVLGSFLVAGLAGLTQRN